MSQPAGRGAPAPPAFATYEDAVAYLFAMVDYEKITRYKYDIPTFDLSRTERLLDGLGAPHHRLRCVHVAGTKGKGSTSAMIQTVLTGMGYRTGLFTSPHFVYLEERVRLDGEMIPKERLRALVSEMRPYVDKVRQETPAESPTFFELMTALGMLYYAQERVDFAVIEVGMGGRLDSTNVILPEVSVITRIDYDHVRRLGSTLAKIAGEKAGIIKPGIPTVSSPQAPEAAAVIEATCAERHAELFIVGRDAQLSDVTSFFTDHSWGCRFRLRGLNREYPAVTLPILGRHQAENAATAIMALEVLERRGLIQLNAETVARWLRQARLMGRIEIIPGKPLIIVDGGHNPAAARALRAVLDAHLAGKRVHVILGVADDKDVEGVIAEIAPRASVFYLTCSDSPRAADPDDLATIARGLTDAPIHTFPIAADALAAARAAAREDEVICITGSIYLAGLLRPLVLPQAYP